MIPPLLYRDLVNIGILKGNGALVVELAVLASGVLLADAGLGMALAWLAAAIGNRIVLSMRTRCSTISSACRSPSSSGSRPAHWSAG